jgi:hypothetical protein
MLVLKVVVGVVLALVVYTYLVAPVVNEWAFRSECQARGRFVIEGGGSNAGRLFCG